jgi:nucleoside-diphosphate-sugar epimerase
VKKVLIVGASGVIGLNLLKYYSLQNSVDYSFEVHALSKRKISEFSKSEFMLEQVIFHENLELLDDNYFNLIFNCGGPSQPAIFTTSPKLVIDANLLDIPKILMKLSTTGTFIQMGTSEIYSGCAERPCTEGHRGVISAHNPRRTYILSKEVAEIVLKNYISANQTCIALRVSLVYGPGASLDDTRVLYEFIRKGLSGEIVVEGSVAAMRRYLFINDFLEMLARLIAKSQSGFHTYNLGGEEAITIENLAKSIGKLTNAVLYFEPVEDNRSLGAPEEVWVSMDKFGDLIGPIELKSLGEGLGPTIEWTKKLLDNAE